MAILQMQRINIFALQKHSKALLETLQRAGVVEIEPLELSDSVFYKEDSSSLCSGYLRNAALMRSAQEVLESYIKYKKSLFQSLKGRTPISQEEYECCAAKAIEVVKFAYELINNQKRIIETKAKIVAAENKIESLIPWEALDVPMTPQSTKTSRTVLGSFAEALDLETLRLRLAEILPDIELCDFEIISKDEKQTCVFVICRNECYDELMSALRKLGFSLPAVSCKTSPKEAIKDLKADIASYEKLIKAYEDEIIYHKDKISMLRFFEDYYTMKADTYAQLENLSYSPHTMVLTGYIPKDKSEKLSKLLFERYDAQVECEDAEGDDVPVVIKNNKFSEPVEGVLLSYSPPKRGELDPTAIMAIFYYIFFGLMFSDAGYGLVMSLACFIAVKAFKNMEKGLKRSIKMFFWCGVSTFIWGLLFGSFFGDAVNVIFETFVGKEPPNIPGVTTPIWFSPTLQPTTLLMFSFALGLVHLYTGLILQAVNYIRDKHFFYAIFDDLSWILLVSGGVIALLSTDMLSGMMNGFKLSSEWMTVGGIMAAIGAVIILIFSDRNRNPIKRFIKGAYNLYGATSYLSDILSYSRLLALGLATGVVAQVFNQLGSMFGSGVVGIIVFILVFIIGHALNIGINALGAYVHTNRLQFVEFFGKFYEGGGKEFTPYEVKTKYYNIKEDI